MTRKSRFEIGENPFGEDGGEETPAAQSRPGPMATAVREAAVAAREDAAAGEVDELAVLRLGARMRKLLDASLDVRLVPLDDIDTDYLIRDRRELDPDSLEELKASILANGLAMPIRLEEGPDGRLKLNQGTRRLQAYKQIFAEKADPLFARIPALVGKDGGREASYRRMVDENLVRESVGYAELARLAIAYGAEADVQPADAVEQLLASAHRSKRIRVKAFIRILDALGDALRFPNAIGQTLGEKLAAIADDPARSTGLRQMLAAAPERGPDAERIILEAFLKEQRSGGGVGPKSRAKVAPPISYQVEAGRGRKTRFEVKATENRLVISGKGIGQAPREAVERLLNELIRPEG